MPNQQLIEYIRQARAAGQSDVDIKSALLGAGWQEADVNEWFANSASSASQSAVTSRSPKMIIAIASITVALLLAGGGFAYWRFAYKPKVILKQVTSKSGIYTFPLMEIECPQCQSFNEICKEMWEKEYDIQKCDWTVTEFQWLDMGSRATCQITCR